MSGEPTRSPGPPAGHNVVPLGVEPATAVPPGSTDRSGENRLHSWALSGMALTAIAGIISMLLLITVNWPVDIRRYVIGAFIASILAFLASASIAVASSLRPTYQAGRERSDASRGGDGDDAASSSPTEPPDTREPN